ncbi:MAG: tRNA pseudouridine(38-40) synthase TruA [Planctomycetes bacterium]|nr:tRNA pseudouridine(38-40) synthase TruA [Planctomycetota bacterium]
MADSSVRKRNVRIVVEYDGTAYYGWQIQKGFKTVQGELQRAVKEIVGKETLVVGAGRTDAGVHARGQVANFHTVSRLSCAKFVQALNAHLPEDIAVLSAVEVPLEFHSQFGAHEKTYEYAILNRPARTALRRTVVHRVTPPLDAAKMAEAAAHLAGTHDFRAFGSEMSKKENSTRTIREFAVTREGDLVRFRVTGDGFLYNQVRSMVGTLLEVGLGKRPPEWVRDVRDSLDRTKAGANVPAKGLTLVEVRYEGTRPGAQGTAAE